MTAMEVATTYTFSNKFKYSFKNMQMNIFF